MTKIHRPFDTRAMMVFLQAAREGSFTVAAGHLGLTPSAVSKVIARLEDELGAKLLHRAPRNVSLTAEGSRFFDEADRLMVSIERARNAVTDRKALPRQKLRVTVPINFGRSVVAPHLTLFLERHPELDINFLLTNAHADPIADGIDVALWFGGSPWTDSRLIVENIAISGTVLCAAPAYLNEFGTPHSIADLQHHRTLAAVDDKTGQVWPWYFENSDQKITFMPTGRFQSNGIEVLCDMAIRGGGIVYLPEFIAMDPIRDGKLKIVLSIYRLLPSEVRLIYPRLRAAKPSVMAFIDLLSEIIKTR
jgi:DNA-binding transcriptional LysR family regulator